MKHLYAISMLLSLTACVHAEPVTPKFPEAPATLLQRCAQLKEATAGMTLSEFTRVVVENYILYHECERKVEGWQEWYARQRAIFENATD